MTDSDLLMTDSIDEAEQDSLAQLQDRIAESLAEMSEAADAPAGLNQTNAQFDASDVDFGSDAWMSRLADVQGWLDFDRDLPTSDAAGFVENLVTALGFENQGDGVYVTGAGSQLTETALERLSERAELAIRLQQAFLAEIDAEGGSRASATTSWKAAWDAEGDSAETVVPEPVTAKADVWHIFQLTKKKLNLTPSYQRGDVWRTGDRQALIESILRGIPLPSIILLRTGGTTPHDVVDGKQRLTAILRFVGQHPIALLKVAEADEKYPDAGLKMHFTTDYPTFRKAWKQVMGEPLTAKLEDDYYFPFKLRADEKGGLVGPDLGLLRGKYFTQIRGNTIHVADQEVTVEDLFEGAPDYKVPVIEYTKASQSQIHEVFKLYNKQGMHLNAEEIRNAIYHDIELTKALLVAAGDASPRNSIAEIAPSLADVPGIQDLGKTLKEYGFGDARYRRTKVLGWVIAVLLSDTGGRDLASTARHIDLLLRAVQEKSSHALRNDATIADLFGLIARAADIHAAHDELWSDKFKDGDKGAKWQELQLVGSLVGITIALAGAPDDIEDRIAASADAIRAATATEAWTRPEKTQTRTQWDYIARLARGLVEGLGVDVTAASDEIRKRFGSSGVESLLGSILKTAE
ncbi:Protein of unknown function DUF262 [Cryobacterium psychrotolerans]|uniref:GmrSD restriction endonucleases N-terminal domain-containing protein n=1 Tax=Cryobacterium psychrotolerans TaxID=386301 RepID=A0A1G8X5F6_9MICO|nr:DUF262 domain-containing protein [Cryobacterium psychrotolerans]TFD83023.1 DUF262 domain-containing protein [Cryobacterium psychrotolerans]SDJ85842.1 Protein of unknown function DUF262 [Cryobacterium psychrotolerans]